MNSGVTLQAILSNVSTRKDGSLKLTYETQELNAKDGAALLDMRNKIGWLLFAADQLTSDDLPEEKIDLEIGEKSPSQRLRSVLFVYWKSKNQKGSFNDFYRRQIETWIENVKEKLDEY